MIKQIFLMKRHFFFLAKAYVLLLLSLAIGPTAQAQDGPGEAYQQAYGYVLDEEDRKSVV